MNRFRVRRRGTFAASKLLEGDENFALSAGKILFFDGNSRDSIRGKALVTSSWLLSRFVVAFAEARFVRRKIH
jgi:hypothetical protein